MSALVVVAACWLAPTTLIALWIFADRLLDSRWTADNPSAPGADAEWLAVLAATEPNPMLDHPSLHAHPAAGRIRAVIAANAAARLDDEWAAVSKEWTR